MAVLESEMPEPGVLLVTINRPECHNAVSVEVQQQLDECLTAAEADPTIGCLVLTGRGERAFSSGYDIHELAAMSEDRHTLVQVQRQEWIWHWTTASVPTIAAVNGIAYGAGAILAVGADLRVGGPASTFKVTASAFGGANLTWNLPALVGWAHAKDLLLTARPVDGEEAYRIGLLNRFEPDDTVVEAAVRLAADIAALPREGVREVKRLLHDGPGRDLRARYDAESTAMRTTIKPGPVTDVFSQFLERRPGPPPV